MYVTWGSTQCNTQPIMLSKVPQLLDILSPPPQISLKQLAVSHSFPIQFQLLLTRNLLLALQ